MRLILLSTESLKHLYIRTLLINWNHVVKCEKCDKGFSSSNSLKQHMINHNDLDVFVCKLCEKPLATKADVEDHMSKVHRAEKLLHCSVCNVPFSKVNYLRAHMLKNHKEKILNGTFKCPKCPEQFLKKSHMKVHLLTHAKEKPFRCDVCGKGFSVSVTLKLHKKKHFDAEGELMNCPVKCGICKKFFKRAPDCQKHQAVHSDVQIYKCDMCDAGFAYPHSLKQHKDTHFEVKPKVKRGRKPKEHTVVKKKIFKRKYKCGLCKAKFPNEERLDDHKNTHFDNVDFFKTFECPVCGDGFKKKADLKIHMEVHEDKGNNEQNDKLESKNSPDYQCDVCEEMFPTLDELQSHDKVHFCDPSIIKQKLLQRSDDSMVEAVSRYGRRRFVWRSTHRGRGCRRGKPKIGFVNKPPEVRLGRRGTGRRKNNFSRTRKFYRGSLRTSARKARFECDRCCSEFLKIKDLKNHLRTHMDEIQCVICKEMFSDSTLFEDHIEGHTENDLSCETCTESFSHFIELQNHIAASHPDLMQNCVPRKNPFYCIICRMTFSHTSHLDAHMFSHNATVRLRRHSLRSESVKIPEKKVLLRSVKCEVEDNSEMFGGISSRQEVGSQQVNSISPAPRTPEISKADVDTGYDKAIMKETPTKEEEIKVEPFPVTRSSKRLIDEKMSFLNGPRRTRSSSVNAKISPEILPVLPPARRQCNRKHIQDNTGTQNTSKSRNEKSLDLMSPRSFNKSKSSPREKKVKPAKLRNHCILSETLPKDKRDAVPDKNKCFKCSVCDEYFAKSSCLENHLIVHSDVSVSQKSEDPPNTLENNDTDDSDKSSQENTCRENSCSEDLKLNNESSSNPETTTVPKTVNNSILGNDSKVHEDNSSILQKESTVLDDISSILHKDSTGHNDNSSILHKETVNNEKSSVLENSSPVHDDDSSIVENDSKDQVSFDKSLANSFASTDLEPALNKNSSSAESSSQLEINNSNGPDTSPALPTDTSRALWRFHLQQGKATTYACVHISNRTAKTCPETYENL